MTLWNKGYDLKKEVAAFTVGNDYLIDKYLLKYDCTASLAHAEMLYAIRVLDEHELASLKSGLNEIISLDEQGLFPILPEDEDCHTAIEKYLTEKYGDTGKKIHTCRSRNDQVLTAMRLYEKDALQKIREGLTEFKRAMKAIAEKYGKVRFPGYTHMQKAMPTDVQTWAGCFLDASKDNIKLLNSVLELIDQSPLGTAAGFGVPVFEIDRNMTASQMGFSRVMKNPIYAQMSRGKFEAEILNLLSQIMFDLNKLSTDLITFSMEEFGYIRLPVEFCTGSSIMPQKKNPDVLELVRAKYHVVLAEEMKVKSLIANLISGYNRDLQLVKEPVINCVEITLSSLSVLVLVLDGIAFDEEKCKNGLTKEVFATEEAYKLAKNGMPFRDAYLEIARKLQE